MTSFILDNALPPPAKPRGEKLLWSTGPLLAVTAHLLVLMYLLWKPAAAPMVMPSPAAAPMVITMAVMPTTSQISSQESVAQQASQPDESAPPPPPAKLDAAEKEVKNAEVKAVVHDSKPQPKAEPKPSRPQRTVKPREVKPLPKKVEVKKPAPVTTPDSMRSNSSEQLSRQNQAPQVGAASNQAASAKQSWQSLILAQLQREKRYPGYALRMKQQDTVMVRFTIDRDGNVLETAIEKSKGYATLDRESLQLLERASPLPKPPASAFTQSDRMELVVPVSFAIRNV
ncbi:TonB family protein [Pantoea coffeiphila]|uniref:TonB family protein n=1 Tax=Pantoea coffeiphila TaxID=1465635 RepID=UPI00195F2B2B|nr:energy transducer TonB [Pantoea coffeiphila]MBM7344501.1 protein TonB [Pantoea coffeiphila]